MSSTLCKNFWIIKLCFKFCVFQYGYVKRILQSIQNHTFRAGSENDKNDLIEKDEIRKP